jgi:hypothetical protein
MPPRLVFAIYLRRSDAYLEHAMRSSLYKVSDYLHVEQS